MKTLLKFSNAYDFHLMKSCRETRKRRLNIDIETYQEFLNRGGVPPLDQNEFFEALWAIILAFIDLGYDVNPVQLAVADPRGGKDVERLAQILVESV